MILPVVVYVLCAAASLLCAVMLLRKYHATRSRLLLWSTVCFGCLAINNVLLFVDLVIVPGFDLSLARTAIAAFGVTALVYGLVWEGA